MLDGASRIGDVVAAAAADGQPAVGITDHGNMYGVLPMYTARARGRASSRSSAWRATSPTRRASTGPKRAEHEIFHLTMLAETNEGYRNLIKVTSSAYLDGYYYKPRSDWELLERHHEGIIATTRLPRWARARSCILDGRATKAALEAAARFQDIFGRDHFFVELQDHGIDDDARVIRPLLDIARKLGAPLLATNDSHYTHKEDAEAHDALLCVQTGALQSDAEALQVRRRRLLHQERRPRCATLFRELPDACDNTLLIAERADVEIEFGQAILPAFPVPEGHDENSYLRELTMEGAKERYGATPAPHVLERIEYELDVIKSMGFSAYFLVVWDLVRYAKSRGIRVGPGRGARPVRASRTACASSTSTRSSTTCCSSGSSTRAASRCPTSTWTSTRATAAR